MNKHYPTDRKDSTLHILSPDVAEIFDSWWPEGSYQGQKKSWSVAAFGEMQRALQWDIIMHYVEAGVIAQGSDAYRRAIDTIAYLQSPDAAKYYAEVSAPPAP
jgi:hypothetical protein